MSNDSTFSEMMPTEMIKAEDLPKLQVLEGFVAHKPESAAEEDKATLMRVGNSQFKTIGDWLGYRGWDMPEEEKDAQQKEAEPILKREVVALYPITLTDKVILAKAGVDVEKYNTGLEGNDDEDK